MGREKKVHLHQVCISDRKAKTHMDVYRQHESNHHPKAGIFSHSHPLNILRNQAFATGYNKLTRTLLQIRRMFFINKNVTGSFCLGLTFCQN